MLPKTCTKCNTHTRDFKRDKRRRDGFASWCRSCERAYMLEYRARKRTSVTSTQAVWNAAHPEALAAYRIARRYGLAYAELLELLLAQEYRCGCCGRSLVARKPGVDHCHDTGCVRGVLCSICNTAIGMLGDNAGGVQRALDYLEG